MASKEFPARNAHIPTPRITPTPPGSARYDGVEFVQAGCDGIDENWVPLTDLARAWSLDYHALRDFVRDRTTIPTEKCTVRPFPLAARTTVHIVIRGRDLARLHQDLRRAAEAGAVENRD